MWRQCRAEEMIAWFFETRWTDNFKRSRVVLQSVSEMLPIQPKCWSGVSKYAGLCTNLIPHNLLINCKVAPNPDKTAVFSEINSLWRSKTAAYTASCAVQPLATTILKCRSRSHLQNASSLAIFKHWKVPPLKRLQCRGVVLMLLISTPAIL